MDAKIFFENFGYIADTSNGVKKLRELVLGLAIHGKLVEQNQTDDTVRRLLEDVEIEKERFVKQRHTIKSTAVPALSVSDMPFTIPSNWVWVRLSQIGYTQTGTTPKKGDTESFGNDIPFIKPADILPGEVRYENEALSKFGIEKYGRLSPEGSVLMVCIGTIGKCNVISRACSFNQQINSITPLGGIIGELIIKFLRSPYFQKEVWLKASSTTIAILNKGKWEKILIPLPPLEEQKRIVAKVDQLMALCDKLEEQQKKKQTLRTAATAAVLAKLVNAQTVDESNYHWQRIASNFQHLCDNRKSLRELRAAIFDLAVKGKLVPQDKIEESAGVLVDKIKLYKKQLLEEMKIRQPERLPRISEGERPYELPTSWQWVHIGDVCIVKGGKRVPRGYALLRKPTPYVYIRVTDMKNGTVNDTGLQYIEEYVYQQIKRYVINKDDVYITIAGTIGAIGIIPDKFDGANLTENAAKLIFRGLNKHYLVLALQSGLLQAQFLAEVNQMAQPKLALKRIETLLLPLPPLEEQKRIVAKVDQLMALCDQLEAKIKQAEAVGERCAESMAHHLQDNGAI